VLNRRCPCNRKPLVQMHEGLALWKGDLGRISRTPVDEYELKHEADSTRSIGASSTARDHRLTMQDGAAASRSRCRCRAARPRRRPGDHRTR